MSDYLKLKTTDHQTVYVRKESIAGIEPVIAGARGSEHVRVYAAGFKWLIDEPVKPFFEKMGIPYSEIEKSDS
ncbi:MAG: hypothetical protein KDD34_02035 [Bdellovibrionales bacterium]|nr:hypothetical protein [Bdellovibrionales bacterium]